MTESRPFSIQEPPVSGEIYGNPDSRKVVVISHGFGVKRDGRGMFTELAERLLDDHLIILFDYVDIDEKGNTTAHPLTEQSDMLQAVLRYVSETLAPQELQIVAHSQGCLVVSIANPDNVKRVVLVSPPLNAPNLQRMQETFGAREGTHIIKDGVSTIKRSDGKLTYIPAEFWSDTTGMSPVELYDHLSDRTDVYFIRAKHDHVLPDQDYSAVAGMENITYIELDGNHDFADEARQGWLDLMFKLIEGN